MAAKKVHLLDPYFADMGRTYCGNGGVTFSAPTTAEPSEATCKTCLKAHARIEKARRVQTMVSESLQKG